MENSRENPPKQSPNRLVQLLEARPLMFWGGMWASLVLVAAVSVSSLVSPGLVGSGQNASGAAIGSSGNTMSSGSIADQPASPATAQARSSFPFWLFSAIALSCTAGSILVSKQLAPQRSRRILRTQSPKPVAAQPLKQKTAQQKPLDLKQKPQQKPLQQKQRSQPRTATPASVTPARTATRTGPSPASSRRTASSSQPVARRAGRRSAAPQRVPVPARRVAIVPPAEAHPLDWKTASIAGFYGSTQAAITGFLALGQQLISLLNPAP